MKTIFVYGILQKEHSAKGFGLLDKYYLGRAHLNGYLRTSLTSIFQDDNGSRVVGDIFEIPDDLEEKLYKFEAQFGYNRSMVKPNRIEDNKEFEAISYLLPKEFK